MAKAYQVTSVQRLVNGLMKVLVRLGLGPNPYGAGAQERQTL
jgi:hypothetical protein